MLEESDIFEGLPLTIGAMSLEAVALPSVSLIAPLKGQMMGVADALKAEIGMVLPPAGQCGKSDHATAYWRSPGQWLIFGALEAGKLHGMAAVADMSDAYGRLRLSGGEDVLARLVEIDLEIMRPGQVAHTVLVDIPATLIAIEGGFEIMVPRSYAGSAVKQLEVVMRSMAARGLVG